MDRIIDILTAHRKAVIGAIAGVLLLAALFNGFYKLGSAKIRSWDEARQGVSAYEMIVSGNYLINTYNFEPDYWNVKPAMGFYNNLVGMKIFGRNIFGFRVVSVFCYLCIAALTFLLLRSELNLPAALVGTAAFIVSPANWLHSFRSGDPDALFMFFCFASFVLMWFSLRRRWMLIPAAFSLGLAFLTKSFHVGPPGMLALIFVIMHWKRYKWSDLLLAGAAGAAPVLLWAALRYHADGSIFFENMLLRDFVGRVEGGGVLCEHKGDPWYHYLSILNHFLIVIPLAVIAAAIALGLFFRGKKCFSAPTYKLGAWAGFCFLFSFTAFSCCSVKLPWYILPSLLYLPVVFGTVFDFGCRWFAEEYPKKRGALFCLPPCVIIAACLVWIGIGEGKAIRTVVTAKRQRDVLTAENGGESYRGKVFYCVDPDGKPYLPRQKFMLVLCFLDGKVVLKDVGEYKNAPEDALLICTFDDIDDDAELRRLAEQTAAKLSLKLVRCTNSQALYRK